MERYEEHYSNTGATEKMKTKSIIRIAMCGVALSWSAFSVADPIYFDPDGAGTEFDPTLVEVFNTEAGTYPVTQDFGVDNVLGVGDSFSESFVSLLTSSNPPDFPSTPISWTTNNSGDTGSFVTFDVSLTGIVTAYDPGADAATGTACLIAMTCDPGDDILSFDFDSVLIDVVYDLDGNLLTVGDQTTIATYDILKGGGATDFELLASQTQQAVGVDAQASSLAAGVWFDQNMNELAVPTDIIVAAIQDSVRVLGTGLDLGPDGLPGGGDDALIIDVEDVGADAQISIPEPATIALLGLGLLGFGFNSRKKKS